jgi:acetyl-CoA carboxylase carboxyltransferase component
MNFMQALQMCTVPKLSVIMRKSYGQAYLNMGGGRNSDDTAAWPMAEVSFMDPDYATEIVTWGRNASDEAKQRTRTEMERDSSAYGLAEIFAVQSVIAPQETRRYLVKQLAIHEMQLSGGVGRHRMAGWPTTF